MKKKKFNLSNLIFILLLVLLLIPSSREKIQLWFNQAKVAVMTPSAFAKADQIQLQPFEYKVVSMDGIERAAKVGEGRVTFISYWATWCPPCIAELPSLTALYSDYGNRVDFLFITNEKPERVKAFLERKGINIPAVNPKMETPSELYERSIPTNYLIDRTGKVVLKEKGAVNWDTA